MPQLLLCSDDREVGRRLEGRGAATRRALRRRIENAERHAAWESPEQLRRAENRRRLLRHRVTEGAGQLGRTSDAPAVVQTLTAAVDRIAVHVEAEEAAPAHEERSSLVEEG